MKRRGRPNSSPNVALFPFLAVLMCTMGALVLMLVVIARNSREQAARESSFVAAPPLEDLEVERSNVAWRVEQLRSSREKTLAQLAEERAQLSHLEDHSRRLRDQLATELADAAMLAQTDQKEKQTIEQLRAELARTEVERKALAEEWENAKKAPKSTSESYAIIPYEGPNQTRRRPIYIECRADSLVLQPEGITLTEQDFLGAAGANNPLAAALRAAREYLGRNQRPGQIDAGEPYPLLLVRPGGIGAYYAARSAMTSWGADFGYELIEDSWELEFLPADAGLAETLARAVDESRRRQVAMAMSAPRLLSASERSAYRTASARMAGGTGSAAGGAGQGGFGSFLPARNTNQETGNAGAPMRGLGGAVGAGSGGGTSPYAGLLTGNSSGGAGAAGGAYPGTGPGGTGVSPYAGIGGNGAGRVATGNAGSMAGDTDLNGYGGNAQGGAGNGGQLGGTATTGQPSGTGGAAGANSFAGGGTGVGGNTTSGNSANAGSTSGGAGGSAGNTSAGGAGMGGGASPIGAPQANANVQLGGDSRREQGPSSANQAATTNGSLPKGNAFDTPGKAYAQPSASPNATSTAANTGAASSATVSGSSSGSGAPGAPPSVNLDATIPPSADAASLAKTRGKDWSLPESKMGAVPVTRPISIECRAERLVLKSERGDLISSQEIALGERTSDSMDALVMQIRRRIDSWGIAGRGMYWRPILMVKVENGGEQRFADLQALLHDSGLDVRKKAVATRIPPPALPPR